MGHVAVWEGGSVPLLTEADAEGEQEAAEEEAGHEVWEGVDLFVCTIVYED